MKIPGLSIALKIAGILIGSWLLIHGLALFGIFLALAYPLWWIISPKKTICIACRVQKNSGYCSYCHEPIKPRSLYPKNLRSAILNAITILLLSLFSILVVYVEARVIQNLVKKTEVQSVVFTIPDKGQYKIGEVFPMDIEISNVHKPVNAIRADLQFDPERLEVVTISTEDSFADVFIQKEFDNEKGFARLTGGLPNPGFSGEKGIFGTIYFKAKKAGLTEVKFLPTSLVLANDGHGTNILKEPGSVTYLILPETIDEYESKEQEVLLNPLVLGTHTKRSDQLHLYGNEPKSKVLGDNTQYQPDNNPLANIENQQTTSPSLKTRVIDAFHSVLNALHKIDAFILNVWNL